jgi:lipopolysaccharide transport system permease protein
MNKLFLSLGWQDIKQAYRRSNVGPFWLTIGMAVQITTIGLVFGLIFKSNLEDYLPFLSVSVILWSYISSALIEGCSAFISAESIIKQLAIPHSVHVWRVVWRNAISLAHNIVLIPIILLIMGKQISLTLLVFVPGFVTLTLFLVPAVWIIAIVTTRYRDMQQIMNSVMTVIYYVTPVMWYPTLVGDTALAHLLLGLNPFYHLLQIVRLPLLGQLPTWENWAISATLVILSWVVASHLNRRFKNKIAFWL